MIQLAMLYLNWLNMKGTLKSSTFHKVCGSYTYFYGFEPHSEGEVKGAVWKEDNAYSVQFSRVCQTGPGMGQTLKMQREMGDI